MVAVPMRSSPVSACLASTCSCTVSSPGGTSTLSTSPSAQSVPISAADACSAAAKAIGQRGFVSAPPVSLPGWPAVCTPPLWTSLVVLLGPAVRLRYIFCFPKVDVSLSLYAFRTAAAAGDSKGGTRQHSGVCRLMLSSCSMAQKQTKWGPVMPHQDCPWCAACCLECWLCQHEGKVLLLSSGLTEQVELGHDQCLLSMIECFCLCALLPLR